MVILYGILILLVFMVLTVLAMRQVYLIVLYIWSHLVSHTLLALRMMLVSYVRVKITVQEYLLARVIFGEFVCKKQLADFILAEFLQF